MKVLLSCAHGVRSWFASQISTPRRTKLVGFDPLFQGTAADELAAAHTDRRQSRDVPHATGDRVEDVPLRAAKLVGDFLDREDLGKRAIDSTHGCLNLELAALHLSRFAERNSRFLRSPSAGFLMETMSRGLEIEVDDEIRPGGPQHLHHMALCSETD
jgi:hypothetical protein